MTAATGKPSRAANGPKAFGPYAMSTAGRLLNARQKEMHDMDNVAEIAGKLSEGMANALFYLPSGYQDQGTIRALKRRGLVSGGLLTELGVAVRAYLQEQRS